METTGRRSTADLLAALGSETRVRIVELLARGERCVCEITPHFSTAFSVVSHHLSVLERAGIITSRRDGRWIRYRLADDSVLELLSLARRLTGQGAPARGARGRPEASGPTRSRAPARRRPC